MQAQCAECGARAQITVKFKGFSYSVAGFDTAMCPVVRKRAEENGGSTNNTDCDHMLKAVSREYNRFMGRR